MNQQKDSQKTQIVQQKNLRTPKKNSRKERALPQKERNSSFDFQQHGTADEHGWTMPSDDDHASFRNPGLADPRPDPGVQSRVKAIHGLLDVPADGSDPTTTPHTHTRGRERTRSHSPTHPPRSGTTQNQTTHTTKVAQAPTTRKPQAWYNQRSHTRANRKRGMARQQTAAKAADHHRKGEHPTAISVHKTITLNLETGRRKCPSRPASQDREQTSSKTRIRAPHWLTTDDSPVCLLLPRPHQGDFTRTLNRSHFAQTSPDNKGRKHQHAHVT